jgi:hypothetical protein
MTTTNPIHLIHSFINSTRDSLSGFIVTRPDRVSTETSFIVVVAACACVTGHRDGRDGAQYR